MADSVHLVNDLVLMMLKECLLLQIFFKDVPIIYSNITQFLMLRDSSVAPDVIKAIEKLINIFQCSGLFLLWPQTTLKEISNRDPSLRNKAAMLQLLEDLEVS